MKKVGKKLLSTALAIVLVIAMAIPAFAADSPSSDGVVTENSGKDANGKEIYYVVEPVTEDCEAAAEAIQETPNLKAALGSAYVEGMEVVDVRSIVLHEKDVPQVAAYALAEDGDEVGDDGYVAFPLTLTFNVPGVIKTTKIAVLAYVNGIWQMLQCVAGDGTIDAVFENSEQFAAVAFVVDKNSTAGHKPGDDSDKDDDSNKDDDKKNDVTPGKGDQNGTSGTTGTGNTQTTGQNGQVSGSNAQKTTSASAGKSTSKVSPKTGDTDMMPVIVLAAAMLLAGGTYVLSSKKKG